MQLRLILVLNLSLLGTVCQLVTKAIVSGTPVITLSSGVIGLKGVPVESIEDCSGWFFADVFVLLCNPS